MKRIFASVLAIALTITAVQAQEIPERKHDGVHRQDGRKKHNGKEMADLNLSEDQKAQFRALNEEHHKQMADLKKQDNLTVKDSKEKMESLRKDHRAKVQALLTPEQKTQLEKKKEERKARMGEMERSRGEKLKTELNLTAEQSAKLDESRKQLKEKIGAIRGDKSLTEEQVKEKSRELRKQQKESMKSILTEEQLLKMNDGRKRSGRKNTNI